MAKKEILSGVEMFDILRKGAKSLNDLVASTYGPNGHNVLYMDQGKIFSTNDGARIVENFKNVNIPDGQEYGASLIKECSLKTNIECGDGTTGAILLSYLLLEKGIKEINHGINPHSLQIGMNLALDKIKASLKKISKDCRTYEDILRVATISGNNDSEIGKMVADIYEKVGLDGIITYQKTLSDHTYYDVREGYTVEKRGMMDPIFINNEKEGTCKFEGGCYVLIAYYGIQTFQEIESILDKAIREKKGLLIVADEIHEDVMKKFRSAKELNKPLKICCINLPSYAHYKLDYVNDLSYFIDGKNIEGGFIVGICESFVSSREETLLVGGAGKKEEIESRIADIKNKLDSTKTKFFNDVQHERMGALRGKLAIINIGGKSELEKRETCDRIDDALKATKSAIAEGICPGGGFTLTSLSKSKITHTNPEVQKGIDLLLSSLNFQLIQVLK